MKGFRSIIAMIVGSLVVPYLARHGFDLTPDQQLQLTAYGMAAVGVVMRVLTHTPVFTSVPKVTP